MRKIFVIGIPVFGTTVSLVLFTFINLCGTYTNLPKGDIYWSKVEISGRSYAWTSYRICEVIYGDILVSCVRLEIPYPYSPAKNFAAISERLLNEMPTRFSKLKSKLSLLTILGDAFLIAAQILSFVSFVFCLKTCNIKFVSGTKIIAFWYTLTFTCTIIGASFITAVHVQGVKIFRAAGFEAQLGSKVFGILWTVVFIQFVGVIASVFMAIKAKQFVAESLRDTINTEMLMFPYSADPDFYRHKEMVPPHNATEFLTAEMVQREMMY